VGRLFKPTNTLLLKKRGTQMRLEARLGGRASVKLALAAAMLALGLATLFPERASAETHYYGIKISGVLCGYSKIDASPIVEDGKDLVLLDHELFLMLSALGSEFNSDIRLRYKIDPSTGRFIYHDSDVKQGQIHLASEIYVEGNTARCVSPLEDGKEKIVELGPDVVLENTLLFPHLVRDFVDNGLNEKTYDVFEVREEKIQSVTYKKVGREKVELGGGSNDAIVLDRLGNDTGVKATMWIDGDTGMILKTELPNARESYLTDESVVKKIELANLDDSISSKVNVAIADVPGITYMKVKTEVEPTGLWITPEGLSVPGQSFTGAVSENLVKGVFEVEHPHYDGAGAPPFPPDFGGDESLAEYVKPVPFIESDDPVLVEKAREITEGAADSWEAARRLSEWVSENIAYAIPGGGSARGAYDTRSGECGAHSMLVAAFCRAVGIPARVVWGCMYTPNFGGSFGQHGWNEIYMGDAGWIPVDATAGETDFVDSGHIRIGEYVSTTTALNPKAMEVLDYRVGSGTPEPAEDTAARYADYVGEYSAPSGEVFKVLIQDGGMAIDIPNRMVLGFSDPDENGRWYCKLSRGIFCTFVKSEGERATEMHLHEMVPMPRQAEVEEISDEVPEDLRPYLGKYKLSQLNAVFTVLYKDGGLAVHDTLEDRIVKLQSPNDSGGWVDEYDKNTIYFDRDDDGNVTMMTIDSRSKFKR
jgi:transglutaminase-like putative cysteine protease